MISTTKDNLNYSFILAQTILEDIKSGATPTSELHKIDEQYSHLWEDIKSWNTELKRELSSLYTMTATESLSSIAKIKENMPSFTKALSTCAKDCLTFDFGKNKADFVAAYPEEATELAKEQLIFYAKGMIDFSKSPTINNLRKFYPDIFTKAFNDLKHDITYGDKNFFSHQSYYKKQLKKSGLSSYDDETREILKCALDRAKRDSFPFLGLFGKNQEKA